jgi:hypothetical protein
MEENKQNQIITKIKSVFSIASIIGIVVGIIGGYIYYIKIGCSSGSCPITSNPYMSMLWGAIIGYLIGDMFKKREKSVNKD